MSGNVLLTINTALGPGGFAAVDSMISRFGQLTQAVANGVKAVDEYNDAAGALRTNVDQAAQSLKGAISTLDLMQTANRAAAAGLTLTSDQLDAAAKLAFNYAEATGGDASQALEQLMNSLIRGSERGLKPFGISLKDGATQAEKFADGLKQVTEKGAPLEVSLNSIADNFEALKNNMQEFGIQVVNSMSGDGGLASATSLANEGLVILNQNIAESNARGEGYFGLLQEIGGVFVSMAKDVPILGTEVENLGFIYDELFNSDAGKIRQAEMAVARVHRETLAWISEITSYADAASKALVSLAIAANTGGGQSDVWGQQVSGTMTATPRTATTAATTPRGGGGGRRKEAVQAFPSSDGLVAAMERDAGTTDLLGTSSAVPLDIENTAALYEREIEHHQSKMEMFREEFDAKSAAYSQAQEYAQFEYDNHQWQQEMLESNRDSVLTLSDAWVSAYGRMGAGTMAFTGVINSGKAAVSAYMHALITGQGNAAAAAKAAVAGALEALAIEATIKSLMAFAQAIYSAATWQYAAAAQFAASGVMYAAVAAAAGAASGAMQARGGPGGGGGAAASSSSNYSGGGYTGPYNSSGQGEETVVHTTVVVDGEVIYDTVRREAKRREASGESM